MNNIEKLAYSTVRIQAFNENGQSHFGTGFLFGFNLKGCSDRDLIKPVLVTNKHMLLGFDKISLRFNISNVYGKPILGSFEEFVISNVEEGSLFHPDPKVDLAVIPLLEFMSQHENLYCQFLREGNIPTEFELKNVFATDEIVMVGYPCGIVDEENNLPVFRKGILSTFPSVDYNGEKKFLIDAACFPGSSGSPVLLYDRTPYLENTNIVFGKKNFLLGIQAAVFMHKSNGEIEVVDVPTRLTPCIMTQIPSNLGIVVKSLCILDFKQFFPDVE